MKFKLYKEIEPAFSAMEQVLYNRGMDLDKQIIWLNAGWECINDWRLLDENKMREMVDILAYDIKCNQDILIVVDADCDGWTSAAILINYLTLVDEEWAKEHIKWIQHKGKQHGLKDLVDVILEDFDGLSSVFVPDAGSNDREEHERLRSYGINVCVLDHHEVDKDSDYAIVINVQLSDYPNKSLTGAGVTWQFCRAFDEIKEIGRASCRERV